MAGETGTDHAGMINPGNRCPPGSPVAVLAQVGSLDMRRILAGSGSAVVAACTGSGDVGMVKHRARPVGRAMAVIAAITAGDVGCDPDCRLDIWYRAFAHFCSNSVY